MPDQIENQIAAINARLDKILEAQVTADAHLAGLLAQVTDGLGETKEAVIIMAYFAGMMSGLVESSGAIPTGMKQEMLEIALVERKSDSEFVQYVVGALSIGGQR